jgi:hypothetical protein
LIKEPVFAPNNKRFDVSFCGIIINLQVANFLQGFSGHLQVDGYAGYHALASEHCILVGCMAHARRKFDEALKVLGV